MSTDRYEWLDDEYDAPPARTPETDRRFKKVTPYPHHRSDGTHPRRAEKRMLAVAARTKP